MSDRDTLTFNAWKVHDMHRKNNIAHQMPPRLTEVVRFKEETPRGEQRRRLLLPPGCGPFGVGSFDVMTDPSPVGSFFRLFYPIKKWKMDEAKLIEFPPWIPSRRYSAGFAKYMSIGSHGKKGIYMKFFEHERKRIYVPTLADSVLIEKEDHVKEMPIIIFSHGLSSCRTVSSSICMDWASYGFVVAAVEHRDGSAAYTYHLNVVKEKRDTKRRSTLNSLHEFENNGVKYAEHGLLILNVTPFYDYGVRNHQLSHRRREMTNCLNALTKLNAGRAEDFLVIDPRTGHAGAIKFLNNPALKKMFRGRLDLNNVIAAGHSFGGATGLVTILKDRRFKCGVVMDPWTTPLGPEVYVKNAFKVPFMMIDSDKWLSEKKNLTFLRCLLADQVRVLAACPQSLGSMICTLRETNHQCFTDFMLCCGPKIGQLLALREKSNPSAILQHIRQLTLAFIKTSLKLKNVMWPQGSKTILQSVQGDQHLDIKHGHRFINDHVLGYEFEMQRLIAFERQRNPKADRPCEHHDRRSSPNLSIPKKTSLLAVDKKQLPLRQGSADGQSFSDPEFFERHSYFVKKNETCCSCMRREIRTVKPTRGNHPLSWTAIIPGTEGSKGTRGSAFASAAHPSGISNTNLSEAFWLARATNYPIPMCYWSLCHHELNETIAEQWLHNEATAHGYHKKDSPRHRGIIGLAKIADGCVMLELGVDSANMRQAEEAMKSALVHKALAKVSQTMLTNHKDRIYVEDDQLNQLQSELEKEVKLPKVVRVSLRRGIVYRSTAGETISTLVTPQIATIDRCQIGLLGLMIHYATAGTLDDSFDLELSHHIIRANPLTMGTNTQNTEARDLGPLSSRSGSHSKFNKLVVRNKKRVSKFQEHNNHADDHHKELGKHYAEEARLLHQRFRTNPNITVGQHLANNNVTLVDFVKFECAGAETHVRQSAAHSHKARLTRFGVKD